MEGYNPDQNDVIETKGIQLTIEKGFENFVPEDFKTNPTLYFKEKGINIKSGEKKFKEDGTISEDPDAVKEFPLWENNQGEVVSVVGKMVNTVKSHVGKSGNPFYEYEIMELIKEMGLPCANPIAKVEQNGEYLFIMEKVPGLRWVDSDIKFLKDQGLNETDLKSLEQQAWKMTEELGKRFTEMGVIRT